MAIPGARKQDTRKVRPIVGMRYCLSPANASGKRVPCLNFLSPSLSRPGGFYAHLVPIFTRSPDSEFSLIYRAVTGHPYGAALKRTAKDVAIELANCIIDKNGAFRLKESVSGRFRKWSGVELVNMGSSHPGVAEWPTGSISGEDLFAGPGGDVHITDEPATCPDEMEEC